MRTLRLLIGFVIICVAVPMPCSAKAKPVKPGSQDKCAVCGMFVAKYSDFAAQIHFRNGTVAHFDGSKDLFKYYLQMNRYNPKVTVMDVTAIYIKDYYSLAPVDGRTASYVLGSDVYGPMGRELIPFASNKDALEFLKDHKGKRILSFNEITPAILKELD